MIEASLPERRACAEVVGGLAGDDTLRWVATDFTAIVEHVRGRLDLSPLATAALGRSLIAAALLLRLSLKTPARLLLEVIGDGPLGRLVAEVDTTGRLRGTIRHPRVTLPPTRTGKLAVGAGVGQGILRVTREYERGSYSSEANLVSGEIGDDVAHFLSQSDQVRAAVLLGVLAKPHGVAGAGGAVIEALPEAGAEILARVEENLGAMFGVSRLAEAGGVDEILDSALEGLGYRELDRRPVCYQCRCNRESVANHLSALTPEEIEAVTDGDGSLTAECVFCGGQYRFCPGELAFGED